jgi:ribonuclease E
MQSYLSAPAAPMRAGRRRTGVRDYMTKRMLIDASHPEETRVVVLDGRRIEDFDYESASRKQLKGNIYLAKVTRVEPSLQAAFIEYGGNRHGFLPFNEIHPDYFHIPVADKKALIAEQSRLPESRSAESRNAESRNTESRDPGSRDAGGAGASGAAAGTTDDVGDLGAESEAGDDGGKQDIRSLDPEQLRYVAEFILEAEKR